MCPTWIRIADEAELLAADRALAASTEPDPRERCLLSREAVLLARAAVGARERPTDGWLVHAACEGVVVHADPFVMWGISDVAEQQLRGQSVDNMALRIGQQLLDGRLTALAKVVVHIQDGQLFRLAVDVARHFGE